MTMANVMVIESPQSAPLCHRPTQSSCHSSSQSFIQFAGPGAAGGHSDVGGSVREDVCFGGIIINEVPCSRCAGLDSVGFYAELVVNCR